MVFKAERDGFFILSTIVFIMTLITIFSGLLTAALHLEIRFYSIEGITLGVVLLAIILFIVYLIELVRRNYYVITDCDLKYVFGIYSGSICINSIATIQPAAYPKSGNRPALCIKGISLKYGDGQLVYLAPANQEQLIRELRKRNPQILMV